MPLLQVSAVTMRFGSLVANSDVSFDVEPGQLVGLIGPNGSGKTTIFNCISGLYRPTSGKITFDGHDITGVPPHKIAKLGLARTFQVVRPLQEMTVVENVMVGSYLRSRDKDEARANAEKYIEMCYLSEWRDRQAGSMPIGCKKRLEVARSLATMPKLLLLDEAVAGLTSTEVKEMVSLILSLKRDGMTILMVEHIMEAIMPIADKMIVLNSGVKIAEGSPAEVTSDPAVIKAYLGDKFAKRMESARKGDAG